MSLKEHQEHMFQTEHQRVMRALLDSMDKESDLHLQLRRLKESLVSVAFRLQVAIKTAQDDESLIATLRKEATEARMEAVLANKRAEAAAELISSLKIEISSLKRKLKESPQATTGAIGDEPPNIPRYETIGQLADREVEAMMKKGLQYNIPRKTGGNTDNASTFQKWKIQQYIYTPDTPAGSLDHDVHTVDMLSEMAYDELMKEHNHSYEKSIKSSAGKMKKLNITLPSMKRQGGDNSNGDYSIDIKRTSWSSPIVSKDNRARNNLWATKITPDTDVSLPLKTQKKIVDALASDGDMKTGKSVKLHKSQSALSVPQSAPIMSSLSSLNSNNSLSSTHKNNAVYV